MESSERINEGTSEEKGGAEEEREDGVDAECGDEKSEEAVEEDCSEPAAVQSENEEEEVADDDPPDDAVDDDDVIDEDGMKEGEGEDVEPSASSSSDDDSEDEYKEEEGGDESDEEAMDESGSRRKKNGERKLGMKEAVEKIGGKYTRPLQHSSCRKCEVCGKEFKWPSVLKVHMMTHVNECPDCDASFTSYHALRTHSSKEHREKIQCPKCHYAHRLASQVRRHFEQNHVQGLRCPIGGCTTVVAFWRLKTHIAKMHANAAAAAAAARGTMVVRPRATVEGRRYSSGDALECEECGRVVESEEELEMHVQSAHGVGVFCPHPDCRDASGAKRMRLEELQTHIEERHADDARLPHFHTQGGQSISIGSETTFSEYAVSHSSHPTTTASDTVGPTSSSVPSCPSTRVRVRRVIYSTDPIEEEDEEEEEEDASAPSTSNGRPSGERQSTRKRKGEERDEDEEGRKKMKNAQDDLDEEIREMEKEQRNERKRDMEVPAFSELGLVCKECGKVYANTDSLRKHKARVHEKRYAEAARSKRYACTEEGCEKAFTTPGALQDHLNRHNGVAAHACDHCDKSFSTRAYYARHLSKYHQISIKSLDGVKEFMAAVGKSKKK